MFGEAIPIVGTPLHRCAALHRARHSGGAV